MTSAGIFTLITNSGRQDRILTANELLNNRIKALGGPSKATLQDITSSHVLFVNGYFRPYAAIAFEYVKVNPNSSFARLGQSMQFSLPQFGDFFNDITLHMILGQPLMTPTSGTELSNTPLMRWCNYPGERIAKKVSFEVNGNPLDEYSSLAYNYYRQFQLSKDKQTSWSRCMGQEEVQECYKRQPTWNSSGYSSSDISTRFRMNVLNGNQTPTGQKTEDVELFVPLLFWFCHDTASSIASVAIPYGQRFIKIDTATSQELVGLYPRGTGTWSDPNGTLGDIPIKKCELYVNNLFVNKEIHDIYIKLVGFNLIRVHRQQSFIIDKDTESIRLNEMKWPTECMFVGARPLEYITQSQPSLRKNMNNWSRFHAVNEQEIKDTGTAYPLQVPITQYTFSSTAVETSPGNFTYVLVPDDPSFIGSGYDPLPFDMVVVIEPTAGIGGTVRVGASVTSFGYNSGLGGYILVAPFTTTSGSSATLGPGSYVNIVKIGSFATTPNNYLLLKQVPTLDSLQLTLHGVRAYEFSNRLFYNGYLPLKYGGYGASFGAGTNNSKGCGGNGGNAGGSAGGSSFVSPNDSGACLLTFSLKPGQYQPSGHINFSRSREIYLEYRSGYASSETPCVLMILSRCINFLLITDGSAVLKYSS